MAAKPELLAPAGNFAKLKTALAFGADAVYLGGKRFSLRSYADNFDFDTLKEAVSVAHDARKKVYVAVNIFCKDSDFADLKDELPRLQRAGVDALIVSDPGLIAFAKESVPDLALHLSTQANTLNSHAVRFWHRQGVERVVLARELSADQVKAIKDAVPEMEIECFVHGAMCISYSGRCLLSNYLARRDANRGECVQACRWHFRVSEGDNALELEEDARGTYLLNSKDLNLIDRIPALIEAGVDSFKIEGRMKSEYYVATVTEAYRRAIDAVLGGGAVPKSSVELLENVTHRPYTHAYFDGDNAATVSYDDSQQGGKGVFVAVVLATEGKTALVEMRNRFRDGETLKVLSPHLPTDLGITVRNLRDSEGTPVADAKLVQQQLYFDSDLSLTKGDILYRRSV